MQRICFVLQVRPDRLAEYQSRHETVWPEMRAALTRSGWSNYSLFLRGDGLLVGYLETKDFEIAREAMQQEPVNASWQSEMSEFFLHPHSPHPGELPPDKAMTALTEVFHLD